ncbi:MAG: hypothetical protein HRU20_22780 [Pseudomonadales bacterium]|nr:hypothetical protein [Pseudomonadales bacterium]
MNTPSAVLAIVLLLTSWSLYALDISVLSDVSYRSNSLDDESAGFELSQIDLFITGNVNDASTLDSEDKLNYSGDDISGLLEVVFEDADGWVLDVERIWVKKRFNDAINLSAGRFHSPLGYYNRSFHHGSIYQLATSRPFFLDFEDGELAVLPTHIVGVMATGNSLVNNLLLSYELAISNGTSINTADAVDDREIDMNNAGDDNDDKAFNARIVLDTLTGVAAGLFYMVNNIAESGDVLDTGSGLDRGDTLTEQRISGLDLRYNSSWIDVMGEFFLIHNRSKVGSGSDEAAQAYFIQASHYILKDLQLGYRYEALQVDEDDVYFNQILVRESADNHVLISKYHINTQNNLKFQINAFKTDSSRRETYYTLQWAFVFK